MPKFNVLKDIGEEEEEDTTVSMGLTTNLARGVVVRFWEGIGELPV